MTAISPHVMMIGAGGMGMAPLAILLRQNGWQVSAWDDHWRAPVDALLEAHGVVRLTEPVIPNDASRVIHTSAVPRGHPLLMEALARGLTVERRGQALAAEAARHKLVAVCGSHGKTTTTALLIEALRQAGFPCNWVLGGLYADGTDPARGGAAGWLVAEIDESDGTIDGFAPEITVAVNLDWDHPDYYRHPEAIEDAFRRLFTRTRGIVLIPAGDALLNRLAADLAKPVYTFGPGGTFTFTSRRYDRDGQKLDLGGAFAIHAARVRAVGAFNAHNASAALAAATLMGATLHEQVLAAYPGVRRRQTRLADRPDLTVYQDYAHHPSEIEALLSHARQAYADRLLTVVFQPHRYSRTAQFRESFARVLSTADRLFLLDVYAAGEAPVPGGAIGDLLAALPPDSGARLARHPGELLAWLAQEADQPQVILFVGAGDIEDWATRAAASLTGGSGTPNRTAAPHRTRSGRADAWWSEVGAALHPETVRSTDEPLGDKTTFGVGGPARYYAEPAGPEDLARLMAAARASGTPCFVLGRGSNVLVADEGYAGLVLRLAGPAWRHCEQLPEGRLAAGAGLSLKKLCADAARWGLTGFECFEGIPGSVGGALRMNAGAMGGWFFERVEAVRWLAANGSLQESPRAYFHPDYRHCPELAHGIVLGARLKAAGQDTPEAIRARQQSLAARRKESQPREASPGCLFKNPDGQSAGAMIDRLGLKGLREGGALVSPKHGNFIVNTGSATAGDVIRLVRLLRQRVFASHGLVLEPEVILLGGSWAEALDQTFAESSPADRPVSLSRHEESHVQSAP